MEEFEFKIGLLKDEDLKGSDENVPPRVALVRQHLVALLDIVNLTKGGADVSVDGFRFVGEEESYPLQ